MIVIGAITVGLILVASQAQAQGNICHGRYTGDQLPNPSDCSTFYVCNHGEAKLFKCLDNLLYDPTKKVCNWAYLVTCAQTGTIDNTPSIPNPPFYPYPEDHQNVYPQYSTYAPQYSTYAPQYPTQAPPQYQTNPPPEYVPHPPPMIDIPPQIPEYNEVDEFYPGIFESQREVFHCTNPEFYFAPHPRSCEKYFICENYRLHNHQCGEGIHWDYVFNQCDFPVKTFCYAGPSISNPVHIVDEPEHIEVNDESTTIGVTGPIAIASIEPPTAAPEAVIECPGTQAFIAHPRDCHKYYICIGGIPIVTSCPEKMAWDKENFQCNEDAWSQCFA